MLSFWVKKLSFNWELITFSLKTEGWEVFSQNKHMLLTKDMEEQEEEEEEEEENGKKLVFESSPVKSLAFQ